MLGARGQALCCLRPLLSVWQAEGVYDLTHDVFAAYDYGDKRNGGDAHFTAQQLAYLQEACRRPAR